MSEKREERTPFYTFARGVSAFLMNFLFPVRYHHREILEKAEGPCILLCNHLSWMDPAILLYPCKQCELRFLGKKELTKNPIVNKVTEKLHMIPVDRHQTDLQAMRKCRQALKEKQILLIFPEGTRHLPSLMEKVETGAAVLALREKVPLIPTYVHGKLKLFKKREVYVGNPMQVEDLYEKGMNSQVADDLCCRIREVFLSMQKEAVRQEA